MTIPPLSELQTSEGRLALLLVVLTAGNERLGLGLTPDVIYALAGAFSAYAVSRGIAKGKAK